jgi:cytochrome c peroxidase
MSANDLISCASCHQQHQSFADGKRTSPGFEGELTHRNSISLINVGFQPSIFWDTSGEGLENDVLRPIINPIEMGFDDVNDLVNKLAEIPDYRDRFENVFGDPEINEERIGSALAQFVGALISYQSKFDAGLINGFINFSDAENKGMDLFFEDALCSRCHNAPFFAGDRNVAVNIGLDLEYEDKGNGNGKFKVPSLRNIALSGPYMHDGRFQSLSEVIQHYSTDIQNHLHLSSQLKDPMNGNKAVQLNLNQDEKDALIAFLNTLTDWHFVNDERFSNPF